MERTKSVKDASKKKFFFIKRTKKKKKIAFKIQYF